MDPASIPANQFHHLENVRLTSGGISSRGGQSRLNTAALAGCITGIFQPEFQFQDAGLLIMAGRTGNVTTSELLTLYDGTTLTPLDNTLLGRVKSWYADSTGLYYTTGATASDATPLQVRSVVLGTEDQITQTVLASLAGSGDFSLGGMARLDGVLYVAANRTVQEVYSLVGAAFTLVRSTASGGSIALPILVGNADSGGEWMAMVSNGTGALQTENLQAGVWSSHLGAGQLLLDEAPTSFVGAITTASQVYVASYAATAIFFTQILNGSITSGVHTIVGSGTHPCPMVNHKSELFYGWKTDPGGVVRVGKRAPDGTFTDTVFSFAGAEVITDLVSFQGALYALRGSTFEKSSDSGVTWTTVGSVADAYRLGKVF